MSWRSPIGVGDDGGYVRFHAPHLGSGLRRNDGGGGLRLSPGRVMLTSSREGEKLRWPPVQDHRFLR